MNRSVITFPVRSTASRRGAVVRASGLGMTTMTITTITTLMAGTG